MKKHHYIEMIFLLTLFLMPGCQTEESTPVSTPNHRVVNREGWNSVLNVSKLGVRQARVEYGHMIQYSDDPVVHLDEGVVVDFFDKNGVDQSHLTSLRGSYHEQSKDVEALDHVVVVSDTGIILLTESLRWDTQNEKIVSDTNVTFIQANDTLYGKGFQSDSNLQNWVILEPWGVREKGIDLQSLEKEMDGDRPDSDNQVDLPADTSRAIQSDSTGEGG